MQFDLHNSHQDRSYELETTETLEQMEKTQKKPRPKAQGNIKNPNKFGKKSKG